MKKFKFINSIFCEIVVYLGLILIFISLLLPAVSLTSGSIDTEKLISPGDLTRIQKISKILSLVRDNFSTYMILYFTGSAVYFVSGSLLLIQIPPSHERLKQSAAFLGSAFSILFLPCIIMSQSIDANWLSTLAFFSLGLGCLILGASIVSTRMFLGQTLNILFKFLILVGVILGHSYPFNITKSGKLFLTCLCMSLGFTAVGYIPGRIALLLLSRRERKLILHEHTEDQPLLTILIGKNN
jgi:hypothetical protein